MKRIGLCLAYKGTNYGQNLQAFATQQIIEGYGCYTEIIDYHSGAEKGIRPSLAAAIIGVQVITRKIKKWFRRRFCLAGVDALHMQNIAERKKQSDRFRKEMLHHVVHCEGYTELKNRSKSYSAVLVGSDQIWLPATAVSNFYTLRFAAPGVTRVSYATSMGVSSYPYYAKKPAADFWEKIDYLSVREHQAKNVIQSICNTEVAVVMDPTGLFSKEQWLKLIPQNDVVESGYILCYLLGNNDEIKQYCRRFADAKKERLVGIMSDECISDDTAYCDEVIVGRGPEDFVNLVRNASYVLTDSFHGLMFSVIHERQFYVFYRRRADVKESRNSRIDNIIEALGLEDRLIKNPLMSDITDRGIDYCTVNKRMEVWREYSLQFLERALGVRSDML